MINHRIVSHRWCLLWLLSITAFSFPIKSFSETYTSIISTSGDPVYVLGSDGFSYEPVQWGLNTNTGNEIGVAGSPGIYPPGQNTAMSQMLDATGSCGIGVSNSDNCVQLLGLERQNGFAYLVGFWDLNNVWHPEGVLPGQNTRFSYLAAGVGWGQTGVTENGVTISPSYANNFLQVIGLGANDGQAYLAAFQDPLGTWHSGGILPSNQTMPLSQLSVVVGNGGDLQVIGRGVSDHKVYLTAFQDSGGNWHAEGLLPGQSPGFSFITAANGSTSGNIIKAGLVQILGVGASDGYIYLPDWQDAAGTWHAAGVLPGQSTPLENVVATTQTQGNANSGWYTVLIVGGLDASDHILRITDWQDTSGTWHAYGNPPAQIPQVPMARVYAANGAFIGIGQTNNHLYLLAYLDPQGTWHNGVDLTTSAGLRAGSPPWLPAVLNLLFSS